MAIRTNFLAVLLIFQFALFAENLKGEDDEIFLYLRVLCVVQMCSHMLFLLTSA